MAQDGCTGCWVYERYHHLQSFITSRADDGTDGQQRVLMTALLLPTHTIVFQDTYGLTPAPVGLKFAQHWSSSSSLQRSINTIPWRGAGAPHGATLAFIIALTEGYIGEHALTHLV